MEMTLSENIRRLRKERSLTQEQLSEVLGVTAGAVYKWEAGLSVPELELIVEMADFFDCSVDVLLGYRMKDNRLDATVKRLREYRRSKDRAGLAEAEKALKKYPHSFEIVHESATLYGVFGVESGEAALHRRALELLEQALSLLGQNTDPELGEQTLYEKMALNCLGMGETDRAIELLREHNVGGLFNHEIGHILVMRERTEEAVPYLSKALAKIIGELIYTINGYANVYAARGDDDSARAILQWGTDLLLGLREDGRPNFLDKVSCGFLAAIAGLQLQAGQRAEARACLLRAKELAAFFDAAPSYDESAVRFVSRIEGVSIHDDIGATAMGVIDNVVSGFEQEEFTALWKQLKEQEDRHEE